MKTVSKTPESMDNESFESVMRGANQAVNHVKGKIPAGTRVHVPPSIDVKQIRKGLNITQKRFSATFGFALPTLKRWESGAKPNNQSIILLRTIAHRPDIVLQANRLR